jgi:hypothetical protein
MVDSLNDLYARLIKMERELSSNGFSRKAMGK